MSDNENKLLLHQALARMSPTRRILVRMESLLPALNPFEKVNITLAHQHTGGTFNSKVQVGFELVFDGIQSGEITSDTTVIAASSGNTGISVAMLCKSLGLKCEIVMQNDTPASKVGLITALGKPVNVSLVTSNTVDYARDKGAEPGYYDTDQYARPGNRRAQKKYLAPQLWNMHRGRIDLIVSPGGTLGTASGLKDYAEEHGLGAKIVLALCAPKEEIPGARDEKRIDRDVKIASVKDFPHRLCATRYQAFLASYAMFAGAEWTPGGPTSGLALSVALRFIQEHQSTGTLEQFRGTDGVLNVVVMCPDDYRLYADLYRGALNEDRDFQHSHVPVERLLE